MKVTALSNTNIQNTNAKTDKRSIQSDEFIHTLNAFILSAESDDSVGNVSVDILTQNELTIRCLLGSVNLSKYTDTIQNTEPQVSYGDFYPDITGGSNSSQIIARNISSLYEGGSVAGNFDGQGLSLGYLQWNIGTGSLQPLLKEMASGGNTQADFDKIFAQKIKTQDSQGNTVTRSMADDIRSILQMSSSDQLKWAKSINNSNNKIIEPWRSAFQTLCTNDQFKNIQDKYAKSYFNRAQSIVEDSEIGVKTVRGYTLAFDIAVQNGSVKSAAKKLIVDALAGKNNELTNPNDPSLTKNQRAVIVDLHNRLSGVTDKDTIKLYYTAAAVAISAKDRYAKDVWARKSTIVSGSGVVHGKSYAFHSNGLSDKALV